MNNRLKALANSVGISTDYLIDTKQLILLEKFAKVVANDCAQVCEDYSQQILKFSQFGSNAAKDCSDLIKERYK